MYSHTIYIFSNDQFLNTSKILCLLCGGGVSRKHSYHLQACLLTSGIIYCMRPAYHWVLTQVYLFM